QHGYGRIQRGPLGSKSFPAVTDRAVCGRVIGRIGKAFSELPKLLDIEEIEFMQRVIERETRVIVRRGERRPLLGLENRHAGSPRDARGVHKGSGAPGMLQS